MNDALYKQLFSHPEIVRDLVAGFLVADWASCWSFRRGRSAATMLTELMLPPPAGLACYQAQQRYLLIDQHHDALRGNLVGLLFRVARARSRTELEIAAAEIAARLRQPDLASARASVVRWLQLTLQDDFYPSMMDLEEDDMKRKPRFCFEEVFTDEFFDRLLGPGEELLRESARQGVQQGMQDGERLALQCVLRDVLAGEDVEAELAAADNTQLRAWIHSLTTSVPRPSASPSRNP